MLNTSTALTTSTRQRALVTGASQGIGAAFAEQLAAQGYELVLVARSKSRLEDLARKLRDRYETQVTIVAVDLTDGEGLATVVQLAANDTALSLLVNAAGSAKWGHLAELDAVGEAATIELNVVALVRLTKAVLPGMVARGQGAIINVASLSAFVAVPYISTYCGTKAFVANFTEALHEELRATGVVVQALCPGFTRTNIFASAGADAGQLPAIVWQTPETVVRCSLKALQRRRAFCVPGLRNHLGMMWMRWMPRWISRRIMGVMFGRFDKLRLRTAPTTAPRPT